MDSSRNPGDFQIRRAGRQSIPVEVLDEMSRAAHAEQTGPTAHGDLTPPSLPCILAVVSDNSAAPWYSFQEVLQPDFPGTALSIGDGLLSGENNLWEVNDNANVPVGALVTIFSGTGDHGDDWWFSYLGSAGSGSGAGLCGGAAQFVDQDLRCYPGGGKLQVRYRNDNVALLPTGCMTQTLSEWGDWQDLDCKGAGGDCPPASFLREVVRCESTGHGLSTGGAPVPQKILQVYQQAVILSYNSQGCPVFSYGPETGPVRSLGPCDSPPAGYTWCLCPIGFNNCTDCGPVLTGSGSPSGSGSGPGGGPCIPGTCSLCADPPYLFFVDVVGMSGLCAAFNGEWNLVNSGACVWSFTNVYLGLPVTATLDLGLAAGGGGSSYVWILTFVWGLPGEPLAAVTYILAASGDPPFDCCQTLNLGLVECSCGGSSDGSGSGSGSGGGCPCCSGGIWPNTWTLGVLFFDGDFAWFGGVPDVSHSVSEDDCTWTAYEFVTVGGVEHLVLITLTAGCPANSSSTFAGWTLQFSDLTNGASLQYSLAAAAPYDCCSAVSLALSGIPVGTGSYPAGETLTPSPCVSPSPPPIAPNTAGGCPACTGPTPDTWTVGVQGGTGCYAESNGSWTVSADGVCGWQTNFPGVGGGGSGSLLVNVSISNAVPPVLTVVLDYTDAAGKSAQSAFDLVGFSGDCCTATTASLFSQFCDRTGLGGDPAAKVTVTPSCSSTGGGGCPPTLSALPQCCGPGGGSGGSGGSGGTGGHTTSCCPDNPLPGVLFATWTTSAIGGYPWLIASIPLTWNGSNAWVSECMADGAGGYANFLLTCEALSGNWVFTVARGATSTSANLPFTCSPLEIHFGSCTGGKTVDPSCATGGTGLSDVNFDTVVVTE